MLVPAIYVRQSRSESYAEWIVTGRKTIETRSRDVLKRFVGLRVLIIRTGNGRPAEIIGSVRICGKTFCPASDFAMCRNETLIPPGSSYDCHGTGKWFYYLHDPVIWADPRPLSTFNVERKTRSFAMISF